MSADTLAVQSFDPITRPRHYCETGLEPIQAIDAWGLGFCLGNCVKYIARCGRKGPAIEDLRKARWYLNHEIERLEKAAENLAQ